MKRIFTLLAAILSTAAIGQAQSKLSAENSTNYFLSGSITSSSDSTSYTHNAQTVGTPITENLFRFLTEGNTPATDKKAEYLSFKEYDGTNGPANNLYYEGTTTINSVGNLTVLDKRFTGGNTGSKTEVIYNTNNTIASTIDTGFFTSSITLGNQNYIYQNGKVFVIENSNDGPTYIDSFIYSGNNLSQKYSYSPYQGGSVLANISTFIRDAQGRIDSVIEQTTPYPYTAPISLSSKKKFTRDAQGRVIVIEWYHWVLNSNANKLYKIDSFIYSGNNALPDSSNEMGIQ
jgi:hypothetical protein